MDSLTEGAVASGMHSYRGLTNQVKKWLGKWETIEEANANAQDFRVNPSSLAKQLHKGYFYVWLYGYHSLFYDLGYTREQLARHLAEWKLLPPKEAIKKFSKWDILTRPEFDKLDAYTKAMTLTAAGMTQTTIQNGLRPALLSALKKGTTLREFKKQVGGKGGKFMNNFHAETIFRTNVNKAYNQGHTEAMFHPDLDELIPGVVFKAIVDPRTTDICRERDGKVYNKDMISEYGVQPPCHFNCRSTLIPADEEDVEKKGFATMPEDSASPGFGTFNPVGVKQMIRAPKPSSIPGTITAEDMGIGSEFYEDFTYGGYMDYTDDGIKVWRPFTQDEILALQKKEFEVIPLRDAKYIESGKMPPTAKPKKSFPDISEDEIRGRKYDAHHDYQKSAIKDGQKVYVTEETAEKYVKYTRGKFGPGEWVGLKPKVKPKIKKPKIKKPKIKKPKIKKPKPVAEPEPIPKPVGNDFEDEFLKIAPEANDEILDNVYAGIRSASEDDAAQFVTVYNKKNGSIRRQCIPNLKHELMDMKDGYKGDLVAVISKKDRSGVGRLIHDIAREDIGKSVIIIKDDMIVINKSRSWEYQKTVFKFTEHYTEFLENKYPKIKFNFKDKVRGATSQYKDNKIYDLLEKNLEEVIQTWNEAYPETYMTVQNVEVKLNKKLVEEKYQAWARVARAREGYSIDDIKIVDNYEVEIDKHTINAGKIPGKNNLKESCDYLNDNPLAFTDEEVNLIQKIRKQTSIDGLEDGHSLVIHRDGKEDANKVFRVINRERESCQTNPLAQHKVTSFTHSHPDVHGDGRQLGGPLSTGDIDCYFSSGRKWETRLIATDKEYTYVLTGKLKDRLPGLAAEAEKKAFIKGGFAHGYSDEVQVWDDLYIRQKEFFEKHGLKYIRIRNSDMVDQMRKKGHKIKQTLSRLSSKSGKKEIGGGGGGLLKDDSSLAVLYWEFQKINFGEDSEGREEGEAEK